MHAKAIQGRNRRFVVYLFCASIILLLLSCSLILKSTNNSLMSDSIFVSIITNSTKMYSNIDNLKSKSVPTPEPIRSLKGCSTDQAKLKVFMYDLPPMFHFGLLGWEPKENRTWPDITGISNVPRYPGGLNLQHSIEYWLTLDLLLSNQPNSTRPCFAIRVANSTTADVIFVPFFSSLSYNRYSKVYGNGKISRNRLLQNQLVSYLLDQEEWKKRSNGFNNHVILAHHPNSMMVARKKLRSAIFVLSDFGRYPDQIANVWKDVIAPYKHVVKSSSYKSATFNDRSILAFFQGAIYRKDGGVIRVKLYHLLKDEKDVHFASGSVRRNGINQAGRGMSRSKFCLNIAGDTPSSNRLFDAIVSHCVPVIISDDIELPFEDVLDYSEFSIFVRSSDAVKKGYLLNLLRGVDREEWTQMYGRIKEIARHFEYQYPSEHGDAVQMIWEAIHRKVSKSGLEDLSKHRDDRYLRSQLKQEVLTLRLANNKTQIV